VIGRAAIVALAVIAAVAPLPPRAVERFYSIGVYSFLQRIATSISNLASFALLDVLIVVVSVIWLALAVRDLIFDPRAHTLRAATRILARTIVWSSAFYLVFLVTWGLNYRRVRLVEKVVFDAGAVTPKAALALADTTVREVNALFDASRSDRAHSDDGIDPVLARSFADAARLSGSSAVVVSRPKRSMLDWYFRRAGISGMTDPFFLETLVATDVLPFERPFVTAHEWSHLAGVADEGEANFIAWVACIHGSAAHKYSGWLFLFQELVPSIETRERAALVARLGDGPRADLRDARERFQRNVNPRLSAAGWRAYDSYLKANRVESGAASYAEVTRLVLGVRFNPDWSPLPR
jgi:hypothetical protein